jgi:hypothetical protein
MTCRMFWVSMNQAPNKIYGAINPLLGLLAIFNIALTLYVCTQFYAYLPTSDTWVYVDFLASAAQGHLDVATLLEKHNGTHVIALPKLVYFFDVWLTQGSGALTVVVSLLAQLGSAALFFSVINQIESLNKNQKIFLGLTSAIFLLSACQVESLLNPANLQWSLLVFSATFTAWSLSRYLKAKSVKWLVGVVLGIFLVGLTSASPLLILIPLAVLFCQKISTTKLFLVLLALMFIGVIAIVTYFPEVEVSLTLLLVLMKNGLKFIVDFMAPPIERLRFTPATLLTGALLLLALWEFYKKKDGSGQDVFFRLLLWFSLLLIVATGIIRSYIGFAYTFRFVNIGLVFSLVLISCLYLQLKTQRFFSVFVVGVLAYVLLLSYVNYKEVSAFGFGRNHVRLNQVAYALDIREPGVVAALPGTIWEQQDYDFVQANKHKLKEQAIGIYSDPIYRQLGSSITSIAQARQIQACKIDILKMRRLLPDQAAYKLTGKANSHDGQKLSRVIFTDNEGIIRGFAIPIASSRDLWQSFREGNHWSGFVNLDEAGEKQKLQAYAYGDGKICGPQSIELPIFQPFIKKQKNRN